MNRKGQALVEFVLILPVFILILFAIIDFGNLLVSKNQLESTGTDIVRLLLNGDSLDNVSSHFTDVKIQIDAYEQDYQKIIIQQNVKLITPGMERILGNPCVIETERIIPNVE